MTTRAEKQRAERVSRLRAKLHGVEAALSAVRKQVAAELERIERLVASVSAAAIQEEKTTTDAARLAGVTDRHLRRLIADGVIAATRVGRAWLVDAGSVRAWKRHPTMGRPREGT